MASWKVPGAVAAARNYYIDAFTNGARNHALLKGVSAPVLMLWGEQDAFQVIDNTKGLDAFVKDLTIKYYPDATHWLPREHPELVIKDIESFLK
ncbi:MAG: alpha/beta hydrolase [Pseudobdellovibrionaceae bacterium]|nr:alpha/beta hydrolase [Pseudobdellovibrionaceae bacterium]